LSAQSMGATVRLTTDRRILMRNTVEAWPAINMKFIDLKTRKAKHLEGLKRRFPVLLVICLNPPGRVRFV